ncbi:MAG: cob(I)yrinic acid a,c-diamide adenosyltransferase [Candidatus Aenigmarchaeota archaeon]|nr:cob(I)yrinic acid a,c-diamide adenosyltransferase [Candidatus Aenigmarchaeota archaeon]
MGYIYLYYGEGAGKTTNALGLALRSVGHKHRVIIIQFLKYWKNTGEYKIIQMLKPYYEIYQFGRPGWFKAENKKQRVYRFGKKKFVVKSLKDLDKKLAKEGLEFAKKIVKKKKPHLLILDEINLALHWKLLDVNEVIKFLDSLPSKTDVVLTGRYVPKLLMKRADFINEIIDVKHPKKIPATKGIQY